MSPKHQNVSSIISSLFQRKREARRKQKAQASRRRRTFNMENLESREMFAVTSISLSGGVISVATDNNATSVTASVNGSNIRVTDATTNRTWDFASSSVARLDLTFGAGNDRFVNNVSTLATRAWGM